MKKLAVLALIALFVPGVANAACWTADAFEWYDYIGGAYSLPEGNIPILIGETLEWLTAGDGTSLAVCILKAEGDTIRAGGYVTDTEGWTFGGYSNMTRTYTGADTGEGEWGCYYWYFSISCPLEAVIGTIDEVTLIATPADNITDLLDPACEIESSYSRLVAYFEVVPPPQEIEIFQDTLFNIDVGVSSAYVPFDICNNDPSADPRDYEYWITSLGLVGPALDIYGDLLGVEARECRTVYAIVDASVAAECDYDTLTILGFYNAPGPGGIYDTCVQVVHVITPLPVPLFTTPVVTIMVLAMVLAAAVIMRRRVTSKA